VPGRRSYRFSVQHNAPLSVVSRDKPSKPQTGAWEESRGEEWGEEPAITTVLEAILETVEASAREPVLETILQAIEPSDAKAWSEARTEGPPVETRIQPASEARRHAHAEARVDSLSHALGVKLTGSLQRYQER
jgi:hypothetical protein